MEAAATLLWGLGSVPIGWGSALCARKLAGSMHPSIPLMIGVQAAVAASALLAAPTGMIAPLLPIGWALGLLAVVDILALRLPDIVTLPLILAGLALGDRITGLPFADRLAGAAAGYAALSLLGWAYARLRGQEGLGLGDAKLLAVAGAWLGWAALPAVVLTACAASLVWVSIRVLLHGRRTLAEPMAFGAPLCGAIWVLMLIAIHGPAAT
jgi:prepilin signal peptidase PulO-like enzyme (type II secretory pathway)